MILGGHETPWLAGETLVAAKQFQKLAREVVAVCRKIRTPDCWFRETPGTVWVLETAGLSWRTVNERCAEDGRLPLSGVLWLLKALRDHDHGYMVPDMVPAAQPAWQCVVPGLGPRRLPQKWQRLLHRRRRRLTLLLHTAAMLEEDVRWDFRL